MTPRSRGRRLLVLAGATCWLACRGAAPPPPSAPRATPSRYEATLRNGLLTVHVEVPVGTAARRPVVVAPAAEAASLLAAGLGVATYRVHPDTPDRDQPAPPAPGAVGAGALAARSRARIGEPYFERIAAGASQVRVVVDYLARLPDVDGSRLAILGSATTGFVALEALALEPRLAVGAVSAACGDYLDLLHRSPLAMDGEALALDRVYEARLRLHAPITHPERLTHAALLMVNSTADPSVPPSCALETARVVGEAYLGAGVPERFRFVLLDGAGPDELTTRFREEARAWLDRWLADGRAAPGAPGPR